MIERKNIGNLFGAIKMAAVAPECSCGNCGYCDCSCGICDPGRCSCAFCD